MAAVAKVVISGYSTCGSSTSSSVNVVLVVEVAAQGPGNFRSETAIHSVTCRFGSDGELAP